MKRITRTLLAAIVVTAGIAALVQCRPAPPVPGLVYVSNAGVDADPDSVSVIDPATMTVIATLSAADIGAAGNEPRNLAASPDRTVVYVPFRHSDNVLVVDPFEHTFTTVVTHASFNEPYAVAFTADGGEAWVVNKQGGGSSTGSITVINTGSHAVIATINDTHFSSPEGVAIAGGKAYVVNRGNGTVSVVSVTTRTWIEDIAVGGEPRYAVATPDGAYVYVSSTVSSADPPPPTVDITTRIRTSDGATADIAVSRARNLAVSPDGARVYAVAQNGNLYSILVSDGTVTTIPVTGALSLYGVAITSDGQYGFVTDESNDAVYVFDPATDTFILDGPLAIPVGSTPRAILGL